MDFLDVIKGRHSIRHFRPDPVAREVVERLIESAGSAPSAMNEQPWQFYCCRGESRGALGRIVSQATMHLSEYMEVLGPKRYEDAVEWYSSLGDAPVLIAVSCVTPRGEFEAMNRYLSVGAAIENLQLAAVHEGLGSCNITFTHWVEDDIAQLLGVPDDHTLVSLIALGYPGQVPPVAPPRRADIAIWFD